MEDTVPEATINRIGFIGNYLPRQCGIATFTTDLCEAIAAEYSATTCSALPVNDQEIGRGAWRERGEISVGAGSFKKKKKEALDAVRQVVRITRALRELPAAARVA